MILRTDLNCIDKSIWNLATSIVFYLLLLKNQKQYISQLILYEYRRIMR